MFSAGSVVKHVEDVSKEDFVTRQMNRQLSDHIILSRVILHLHCAASRAYCFTLLYTRRGLVGIPLKGSGSEEYKINKWKISTS